MQLALLVMYNASLQERPPRNELKFYTEHHDEYAGLLFLFLFCFSPVSVFRFKLQRFKPFDCLQERTRLWKDQAALAVRAAASFDNALTARQKLLAIRSKQHTALELVREQFKKDFAEASKAGTGMGKARKVVKGNGK